MARGYSRTFERAAGREAGLVGNVAGLSAVTTGRGGSYRTVFKFTDMRLPVTDALAYASQKIFGFSAGYVRMKGGSAALQFGVVGTRSSTINDNAALKWALGSAAASNSTLATTMVDFIAKTSKTLDGVADAYTTASNAAVAAAATFDGTSSAINLYLNVAFETGTDIDADGILKINGTITLLYELWGDV